MSRLQATDSLSYGTGSRVRVNQSKQLPRSVVQSNQTGSSLTVDWPFKLSQDRQVGTNIRLSKSPLR